MIPYEQGRIDELVQRPSEGLNLEIKAWLDPSRRAHVAKIVRACLALRNRNGGFLLIGFDDKTLLPDTVGSPPADPRATFHVDAIQDLVSKYAAPLFEITVAFSQRGGVDYPVIIVPDGLQVPVCAKADLIDDVTGKHLISINDVYCRTLQANGRASTSKTAYKDWPELIEFCLQNREADIGRFLRRQLAGADLGAVLRSLSEAGLISMPGRSLSPTVGQQATELLRDGLNRLFTELAGLSDAEREAIGGKGWWSVALVIDPARQNQLPERTFLNVVGASNPNYSGWPIWMDTTGFADQRTRPKVVNGAWQSFVLPAETPFTNADVDFIRFDPAGRFFLSRILWDDMAREVSPLSVLDPVLVVKHTTEAMAVGLALARSLGWEVDSTLLGFAFKWTGLRGRQLRPWAHRGAHLSGIRTAHDAEAESHVELRLETAPEALAPAVAEAVKPLFVLFDGFVMPLQSIENWVRRVIERRL